MGKGQTYKQVQLAELTDIALMKLVALVQRGTRRDFVDLYFLDKEHDADKEEMPKMFREVSWEEIKKHFLQRQKELTMEIIEGKEV